MIRADKQVLLVKTESSYGVDALPLPASDSVLAQNVQVRFLSRSMQRNPLAASMGNSGSLEFTEGVEISFETELKGSGAAGTPPEIAPLLKACNLAENITPSSSVDYTPHSLTGTEQGAESVSIYLYYDHMLIRILGARGDITSIQTNSGAFGLVRFRFHGFFATPADTTFPAWNPDVSIIPPRFVNALFSIDSYAGILHQFSFSLNNTILPRRSANATNGIEEYLITGRNPAGRIDPEFPTPLTTKDFFAMRETNTKTALHLQLGNSAGNIISFDAPFTQIRDVALGERDNTLVANINLSFTFSATGDDEFTLSFT